MYSDKDFNEALALVEKINEVGPDGATITYSFRVDGELFTLVATDNYAHDRDVVFACEPDVFLMLAEAYFRGAAAGALNVWREVNKRTSEVLRY